LRFVRQPLTNTQEVTMNRKDLHNTLPNEDREIQNRFTAYVREAMANTRSTYYTKKMTREERETVYDEADDFEITDFGDVLDTLFPFNMDMLENLSLWKALRKLSGKDITIIKLRVLYDNSFKEIGKVLVMTEGAVKMRYIRAIKLLRDIVEE